MLPLPRYGFAAHGHRGQRDGRQLPDDRHLVPPRGVSRRPSVLPHGPRCCARVVGLRSGRAAYPHGSAPEGAHGFQGPEAETEERCSAAGDELSPLPAAGPFLPRFRRRARIDADQCMRACPSTDSDEHNARRASAGQASSWMGATREFRATSRTYKAQHANSARSICSSPTASPRRLPSGRVSDLRSAGDARPSAGRRPMQPVVEIKKGTSRWKSKFGTSLAPSAS